MILSFNGYAKEEVNQDQNAKLDKIELWALNYLYHVVMIEEWLSLQVTIPDKDQVKMEENTQSIEFKKAFIALLFSKQFGHYLKIPKIAKSKFNKFKKENQKTLQLESLQSENENDLALASWNLLHRKATIKELNCQIPFKQLADFAKKQKDNPGGLQAINTQNLQEFQKLSLEQQGCFLVALMGSSESAKSKGYEPLVLMKALKSHYTEVSKLPFFQTIFTIRLIQKGQYPPSLRSLAQLSKDPKYKPFTYPVYQIVQKIYVRTQKGEGKVALGGI